jgi:bifunctional DNA-binding transcriptional regulator/antitoxin component of YhaV-PrlF toxin-antitoxin module
MPKTRTTISVNRQLQYQVTIPKALAEAMGFKKGDKVEWGVISADSLVMRKVKVREER